MTETAQNLATEAMRLLGLLEAMEEASSEDAAHITRLYRRKLAEWKLTDLAYWNENEIPDEIFQHVARVIADDMAPSYGKASPMEIDDNGQQVSMGVKGMRNIRRLTMKQKSGAPVRAEYM